jgi:hypothetical protein
MCTLIICREKGALRLAANRDERLDRPSAPPCWHPRPGVEGGAGLWPVDLEAGGTWIGLNEAGVVAAITNRFWTSVARSRPSRGRWVPAALAHQEATRALEALGKLVRPEEENGFHLLVADRSGGAILVCDGARLRRVPLPLGPTVVTERSFGPSMPDRERRLRQWLHAGNGDEGTLLSSLEQKGEIPSIDDVDVHLTEHGYGTRSRSHIELGPGGVLFRHRPVRPEPGPWVRHL